LRLGERRKNTIHGALNEKDFFPDRQDEGLRFTKPNQAAAQFSRLRRAATKYEQLAWKSLSLSLSLSPQESMNQGIKSSNNAGMQKRSVLR
jgi:hypothetical protein